MSEPVTKDNFWDRGRKYLDGLGEQERKRLPVLARDTAKAKAEGLIVAELGEWLPYFDRHLAWRPKALAMVLRGELKAFTVPALRPEFFDSSYVPWSMAEARP